MSFKIVLIVSAVLFIVAIVINVLAVVLEKMVEKKKRKMINLKKEN